MKKKKTKPRNGDTFFLVFLTERVNLYTFLSIFAGISQQ